MSVFKRKSGQKIEEKTIKKFVEKSGGKTGEKVLAEIIAEIELVAREENQPHLVTFFKTKAGDYAEKDLFLGLSVPRQRLLAKKYYGKLSLSQIQVLLKNETHEYRLIALLLLIWEYQKGPHAQQNLVLDFYLEKENLAGVNNWDLVDLSAPHILGRYLLQLWQKNHKLKEGKIKLENTHENKAEESEGNEEISSAQKLLNDLIFSPNFWFQRVAIVSTLPLIKEGFLQETLRLSQILLPSKEDLIHKAVGWMLREVGKKDRQILKDFLRENYFCLPRTTLRYAIEKFSLPERKAMLEGNFSAL